MYSLLYFFILFFPSESVRLTITKKREFMNVVDLETTQKRSAGSEVNLDINDEFDKKDKNNQSNITDYSNYDDYEFTKKSDETSESETESNDGSTTISQTWPEILPAFKSPILDKSTRDQLSRRVRQKTIRNVSKRTTITQEIMTTAPLTTTMTINDVELLKKEEEGSNREGDEEEEKEEEGEGEEKEDTDKDGSGQDNALIMEDLFKSNNVIPTTATTTTLFTNSDLSTTTETTTKNAPILYTTVIQEVHNIPPTEKPDPFENLDYDLSDHSSLPNHSKFKKKKSNFRYTLHGGAIDNVRMSKKLKKYRKKLRSKKLFFRRIPNSNKNDKTRILNLMRRPTMNRMRIRKIFSQNVNVTKANGISQLSKPPSIGKASKNSRSKPILQTDGETEFIPISTQISSTQNRNELRRGKRNTHENSIHNENIRNGRTGGYWKHSNNEQENMKITQVDPSPLVRELSSSDDFVIGRAQVLNKNKISGKKTGNSMKKVSKKTGKEFKKSTQKPSLIEILIDKFVESLPYQKSLPSTTVHNEQWT